MNPTSSLDYEDTLLQIARSLPTDRAEQLLDFARFLEAQALAQALFSEENSEEIEADNDRWDALLDSEAGQGVLDQLAQEALAEHKAGNTRSIAFDHEGRIIPL